MKLKRSNLIPLAVSSAVLALVGMVHLFTRNTGSGGFVDQLEWITYDARLKLAANFNDVRDISPKLATLFLDDRSLKEMNSGNWSRILAAQTNSALETPEEFKFKWPWPMFVQGQLIREISAQGALAVGYDILFAESEANDCVPLVPAGDDWITSEEFFIQQLQAASNVIMATQGEILPADPYLKANELLGNIEATRDDGVVRRVKPYSDVRVWHQKILEMVKPLDLELGRAVLTNKAQITIPIHKNEDNLNPEPFIALLNPNGSLQLNGDGDINTDPEEKNLGPATEMPFTYKRVWNLGVVMAAKILGLDLSQSEIYKGHVVLNGINGVQRVIELDPDGSFYIDWSITFDELKDGKTPIFYQYIKQMLASDIARGAGDTNVLEDFKGKVVLIGSIGTGNNIADRGATPLEQDTFLVIKHLNVANSILNGRFISRVGPVASLGIILILGIVSAVVTWKGKVVTASMSVCVFAVLYIAAAVVLFLNYRYWLDIVMPVGGGLILPHFALVSYRVMFEQKEQKRVKGIFTKIVSPDVVQELLGSDDLSLGGVRRYITVFFADVRGFTEFCDSAQTTADEYVRKNSLADAEAQKIFDQQAAETLATVNLYLGIISDMVKKHNGTLDKYIGDCVMAFWGAPVTNEQHALCCVRAAIDAQRGMYAANQERFAENERRKKENLDREAAGKPPLPLLSLLSLGTGINTGFAVVGLMGSDSNIVNYTAFGPEVNLASRLEGTSGRGRIVIGEKTYLQIKRDDPTMAEAIISLPPVMLKGVRQPVKSYEVPWKLPTVSKASDKTALLPPPASPNPLASPNSAASATPAAPTPSATPAAAS